MITSNKVMRDVQAERFAEAEKLMQDATSEELNKIWQDAAYVKERSRYLMALRFGVIRRP